MKSSNSLSCNTTRDSSTCKNIEVFRKNVKAHKEEISLHTLDKLCSVFFMKTAFLKISVIIFGQFKLPTKSLERPEALAFFHINFFRRYVDREDLRRDFFFKCIIMIEEFCIPSLYLRSARYKK